MEGWRGKVAVVTGASSGIGLEITKRLAENGMTVVGLARRDQKIKDSTTNTKGTIHAMKCDLTITDDIIKVFKEIDENHGGVDLLVNSAGFIKLGGLTDGNVEDWKTTLDVNVLALCTCTREAIKSMNKNRNGRGQIVHMNSIAGHTVPRYENYFFGVYYASKYAVTALTESLTVELLSKKSAIKVTSISPGSVYTDAVRRLNEGITGESKDEEETKRPPNFMETKDVFDALKYVLSTPEHVQVKEIIVQPIGQPYN